MSQQHWGVDVTFEAGEDLSAAQWHVVALGASDGEVVKCSDATQPIGVLQNAPSAGEEARVRMFGTTKAVAGGAVSRGDLLMVDANGQVVTATSIGATWAGTTVRVIGIALEAASAAGEIIEVALAPHTYGT